MTFPPQLRQFALGDRSIQRRCMQAREAPSLLPLVIEQLIHSPIAIWLCEPSQDVPGHPEAVSLSLQQVNQAAVLFTNVAHCERASNLAGLAERHCWVPDNAQQALREFVEQRLPLLIDPGAAHSLFVSVADLQALLSAWESGEPQPAALPLSREFTPFPAQQVLLDRLAAYLGQFPEVEQAWVCSLGASEGGALVLQASTPDDGRIRQALPLLSHGMRPMHSLFWLTALSRPFKDLPAERQALLLPVYNRVMAGRRAWRVLH